MIADIIAQDADGHDVLVVEIKTRRLAPDLVSQFFERMGRACPSIPFAMFVDVDEIRVVRQGSAEDARPACTLKTAQVLGPYDPEFGSKRIYHGFLRTLVEAWLRDLAYRWKTEVPPGSKELAAIGLLQHLEGGMTKSEVPLGPHTVC